MNLDPAVRPRPSTYTCHIQTRESREAPLNLVDEQLKDLRAACASNGLKLLWTVETHAHADHTSAGLIELIRGARTYAPRRYLRDGDPRFGPPGRASALALPPGHTAGSMKHFCSARPKPRSP